MADSKYYADFCALAEEQLEEGNEITCEDCGKEKVFLTPDDQWLKTFTKMFYEKGWGMIRMFETNHKYLVCPRCRVDNLSYIAKRRKEKEANG